jgi:hypothetical protein
MRLSFVLGMIYFVSEFLLSVTRRGRSETGTKQDKSTLRVLWIVIMASIAAGVFVAGNWKAGALPNRPEFAIVGVMLFALGLAFRWWAIVTLGRFFTVDVTIEKDHELVERGPFRDYLCGLTGRAGPRIAVLTTASGDDPAGAALTCAWFEGGGAEVGSLALFPMPSVADPEDFLLSRDLIFVGGGSVANMLAVWRVHQLDRILRAAWQAGVVLSGVSAGAICWFGGGTTDSFGPDLRAFTDGLGFLLLVTGHQDEGQKHRNCY